MLSPKLHLDSEHEAVMCPLPFEDYIPHERLKVPHTVSAMANTRVENALQACDRQAMEEMTAKFDCQR